MKPGEKIKFMREAMTLTQYELANLCHRSPSLIAQYENGGRQPSAQVLEAIEKLYDEHQKKNQHIYFKLNDDDFPQKLRAFRYERKLKQAELAKVIGSCQTTIMQWETGRSIPSAKNIKQLQEFSRQEPEGDSLATYRIGFPGKVKRLLEHLSMTQEELAKEIGVVLCTVSTWTLEKFVPTLASVRKIEEFCAKRGLDFNNLPKPRNNVSGDEVRKFREEFGLSQQELASIIKTTQEAVSLWERGTIPHQKSQRKLRKVIGMRANLWTTLHNKLKFLLRDMRYPAKSLEERLGIPEGTVKMWLGKTAYPNKQQHDALNKMCARLFYEPPQPKSRKEKED